MLTKKTICKMVLDAGFVRARILSPFESSGAVPENYRKGAPSLLVTALPYGNTMPNAASLAGISANIAPFAQRNYYREAVKRLQKLAQECRSMFGGTRQDYRILCNSPLPEKPLSLACGLGTLGRNSLVITPEAGSLIIIAAMTLPFALEGDEPLPAATHCTDCAACVKACPTQAVRGDGSIDRLRCIQWYASGNEETVPEEVIKEWGQTLYGCTICQDVCPHNKKPIPAAVTEEGYLPASLDPHRLLALTDEEIRAFFKGTAMGLSWLGPEHIRRNVRLVLRDQIQHC